MQINFNDSDAGDRQMQNVFLGVRTGPLAWLAEVDYNFRNRDEHFLEIHGFF